MRLSECAPSLGRDLIHDIQEFSISRSYDKGEFIVREGQFIRHLPLVLEGHIRISSQEEQFQFLLYYMGPGDACIFSFAHLQSRQKAEFSAVAEVESRLLLLPIDKVEGWLKRSTAFNQLIIGAYQKHYQELLECAKQVICYNLEDRLKAFLQNKVSIEKESLLTLSHQQIADALGTSREVISRLMKKLALGGLIEQQGRKIKVLE